MNESTFIEMIRAHPDDDGPRLIFADWLEEQGEADRGEFIRIQIELAQINGFNPHRAELKEREESLLDRNYNSWIFPLRTWAGKLQFQRGMIEGVRIAAIDFIKNWRLLFEASPIRAVQFQEVIGYEAALAECPGLAAVRFLDLECCNIGEDGLALLLASPHLRELHTLDLGRNYLLGDRLRSVFAHTHLPNLRKLGLSQNDLRARGLLGLEDHLPALTALDLGNNDLTHIGSTELASVPLFSQLRTLDLSVNSMESQGVAGLIESTHLNHLIDLNLNVNLIDDDGAIALATATNLMGLEYLHLARNRIGSEGAKALAQTRQLAGLKHLNLRKNRIGRSEARLLQRRFGDRVQL